MQLFAAFNMPVLQPSKLKVTCIPYHSATVLAHVRYQASSCFPATQGWLRCLCSGMETAHYRTCRLCAVNLRKSTTREPSIYRQAIDLSVMQQLCVPRPHNTLSLPAPCLLQGTQACNQGTSHGVSNLYRVPSQSWSHVLTILTSVVCRHTFLPVQCRELWAAAACS